MGVIVMPGGGGGADVSVVTATAADVVKNKVIVGPDGEPITGSMESMSGGTYTPSGSQQTISCTNKKMTSDIVLGAIPNNYMKVELFYDLANPIICSDWLDINSNVPDKADQTVYKGFDVDNNICPVVDDIAYLWVILTKDTKTGKYVNYLTSGIIYSELLKPDIQRLRLPLTTGYFGGLRFFLWYYYDIFGSSHRLGGYSILEYIGIN